MNPIVKATAKLVRTIRESEPYVIREALDTLQEFADSWLVKGDGLNLEGAGECTLADTDTTEAVKTALEIWCE